MHYLFPYSLTEVIKAIIGDIQFTSPQLVLNLECGDGFLINELANRFNNSQFIGTDNNAALLTKAIRSYQKSNLLFSPMNPEKNLFNNYFDLVIFFNPVNFNYEPSDILEGIKKSLHMNGQVILILPLITKLDVLIELTALQPQWRQLFSQLDVTRHFYTKQKYLELITNAGLAIDSYTVSLLPDCLNKKKLLNLLLIKLPQIKQIAKSRQIKFLDNILSFFNINEEEKFEIDLKLTFLTVRATYHHG